MILTGGVFGRPVVSPAGIPADRLKLLRDEFVSALKDPELKAEAKKGIMNWIRFAGEDMELAREVMSQPQTVIDRMKKYWETEK